MNKIFLTHIFTMLFFFSHVGFVSSSVATKDYPKGIMAFGWGKNFQDTTAMSYPHVSGMTAYFGWNQLEKNDGVYDFSIIDKLIINAKNNGKKLNLGIYPGSHAPEWLYQKGVEKITWERHLKEDQALRRGLIQKQASPLPWDLVFRKHWKRFISEVGRRYDNNDSVGYISLTGPTLRDLSMGILLKKESDWNKFVDKGYTINRLYHTWVDTIEHYQSVFHNKQMVLAIAPERPASTNVILAKKVSDYISSKEYKNISLLCVFLNDTWFTRGGGALKIREILRGMKAKGYSIGYQMAQSAFRNSRWKKKKPIVKNLKASLELGVNDGASWIEVWHDDLVYRNKARKGMQNDKYVEDVKWGSRQLLDN